MDVELTVELDAELDAGPNDRKDAGQEAVMDSVLGAGLDIQAALMLKLLTGVTLILTALECISYHMGNKSKMEHTLLWGQSSDVFWEES